MNKTAGNNLKGSLILLLTAFIWGIAFAFQKQSMDFVGPFFFVFIRMFLGGLTLFIFYHISRLFSKTKKKDEKDIQVFKNNKKSIIKGGIATGIVIFFGSSLQQTGLLFTSASEAAFITALYMILVPVIGIFLKHKTHWNTWISVCIALIGIYLLSITSKFTIEIGDLIVLISTFFWASHILITDYFAKKLSHSAVILMCTLQFSIASFISFIGYLIFDSHLITTSITLDLLLKAAPSILYVGILSTGVAFTLQAVGQKYAAPAVATLVMSLESVFGAVGGIFILSERLDLRESIGCTLVFIAVLLAQITVKSKKKELQV
ncbi:MAG: DMT family transporter [Clostridiales Family XIII bacterium]|jgi:drug/metabolite transporter (DMT)-like permease|nr:DMT family transporter [Clostridiales Family XIII bacterium]